MWGRDIPATFDRCTVIGERVVAQPGGFYSGGCSIQRMYRTGQGFPAIWFGPWYALAVDCGELGRGQPTDRRGV